MNLRRLFFSVWVGVVALALAACGNPNLLPSRSISVELTEFVITPSLSSAQVNQPLTFEVVNKGVLEHNLTLVDTTGNEVALLTVKPGRSGELTFQPSKVGEWQIICTVAGHQKAGMAASLTVAP
jgi:uncharacterized cupredoxin-like copper-binding protein